MPGDSVTETPREKKSRAGKIGGEVVKSERGREHFRQMGLKGGAKNAEKGHAHMAAIGRLGAAARWGARKEQVDA